MSLQELAKYVYYDDVAGYFFWITHPTRPSLAGKMAGYIGVDGYRKIGFCGKKYQASNLAYYIMTGKMPPIGMVVDHKNRSRADDRWANLRLATYSENNQNVTTKSNTGIKGIRKRINVYEVYSTGPTGSVYLGSRSSLEDAIKLKGQHNAPL